MLINVIANSKKLIESGVFNYVANENGDFELIFTISGLIVKLSTKLLNEKESDKQKISLKAEGQSVLIEHFCMDFGSKAGMLIPMKFATNSSKSLYITWTTDVLITREGVKTLSTTYSFYEDAS